MIKENRIRKNFDFLITQIKGHDKWMDETINLIASENKLSPALEYALKSDLGNRVAEGWLGSRFFPGLRYYDRIEKYGMQLIRNIFKAEFVDIRPISGTIANMVIFTAFTSPGDTIVTLPMAAGAHVSMAGPTPKKVFNLKVVSLPFNSNEFNIDYVKAVKLIKEIKPRLVVLGGSVLLFKQPVKAIVKAARKTKSLVLFDGAHVAGLIAAGLYPNPFDEGVDFMTMTTCKTIPGPQHAFVLSRKKFAEQIKNTTFPALHSGHHLHETVASVLVMEEFRVFGKEYAKQVIKNSKQLAKNLSSYGFNILAKNKGFTETHMFLLDISQVMPAVEAQTLLEAANIIVNKNALPDDLSFITPSGLRFGTPEVTRLGMKENDMQNIADFIYRVLIKKEEPARVKKEVSKFRKNFKDIKYCFQL